MIAPDRLRTRLTLVMLLAFLPILALILYRAYQEQERRLAEIDATEARIVRQLAATYDQAIERAHEVLRVLAQFPAVRNLDPALCQLVVSDLVAKNSQYANVAVARIDGEIFCSAVPLRQPVSAASVPAFRRAIEGGGIGLGEYRPSVITGQPGLAMALAVRMLSPVIM